MAFGASLVGHGLFGCLDPVLEKPLFVMSMSVIMKLAVPVMARFAGNIDAQENSVTHIFGQGYICVAMDFLGWMEAASIMFFLTGLLDCWAVVDTLRRYRESNGSKDVRKGWNPQCTVFAALLMACFQGFFLVSIWNPTKDHNSPNVFMHALPYVMLRVGYFSLVLFLMLCFPPGKDSRHSMKFGVLSIVSLVTLLVAQVYVFWAFAVLVSNDASSLHEQALIAKDMPGWRFPFLRMFEMAAVIFLVIVLLVHPLGCVCHVPERSDTEQVQVEAFAQQLQGQPLPDPSS